MVIKFSRRVVAEFPKIINSRYLLRDYLMDFLMDQTVGFWTNFHRFLDKRNRYKEAIIGTINEINLMGF